eukprot:5363239-Pyramimonas_sp.AAC.1
MMSSTQLFLHGFLMPPVAQSSDILANMFELACPNHRWSSHVLTCMVLLSPRGCRVGDSAPLLGCSRSGVPPRTPHRAGREAVQMSRSSPKIGLTSPRCGRCLTTRDHTRASKGPLPGEMGGPARFSPSSPAGVMAGETRWGQAMG